MLSSFSLLLSARVAVATHCFADGPYRLLADAVHFARLGGIARVREGLDIEAPLLASTGGVDHSFARRMTEVREEYEHAYRTHVAVTGEYYALSIRDGWVRIRSLERDGAQGSVTVSAQSASGIFRLIGNLPASYRLRRDFMLWGGSHFVRVDDPAASHFGQLYLEADHPSRGGMYFGNPATEHLHLSAFLALERRAQALAGGSPRLVNISSGLRDGNPDRSHGAAGAVDAPFRLAGR